MGIQTTQDITRHAAIDRIREISSHVLTKDYQAIDKISFETDFDVQSFVDDGIDFEMRGLLRWSDDMLERKMDEPFYRHSLFDNYCIVEDD